MVGGFGHVHPCPCVVHTDASVDFKRRGPVRRLGKARDGEGATVIPSGRLRSSRLCREPSLEGEQAGSESEVFFGRRSARRVASAVDVDRIRGGSWALEVAGVLRVASAVVADQIRVGSWAHEEAKSRRSEERETSSAFDGEAESSGT